jgi:MoaA/NifB/PqqE/SkfB family radical SAM enzyme
MYRPLADLLAHARARQMRTLVTTNGTLSEKRRLEPLAGNLDLLAVSLDGPPDEHDQCVLAPERSMRW